MKPVNQLRSNRGVATSLIETVLVISVTAILASIAMIPALGGMDDAKISKAFSDTELIGIAIHNFAQDITAPPAFKSGQATSPTDDIFYVLETDGEDATDSTSTWPTDTDEIDLMENHLMMNQPDVTAPAYPRRGDISFNRQRGWNGPYLTQLPSSDPWGDKYLANVQFLTPQGVEAIRNESRESLSGSDRDTRGGCGALAGTQPYHRNRFCSASRCIQHWRRRHCFQDSVI